MGKAIERASQLGFPMVLFFPGEKEPGTPPPNAWENMRSFVEQILRRAEQERIVLTFENNPRIFRMINSTDETARLLRELSSPFLQATVDIGHFSVIRESATEIRKLAGTVIHAHITDNDGTADTNEALGTGVAPIAECLQELHAAGVDEHDLAPGRGAVGAHRAHHRRGKRRPLRPGSAEADCAVHVVPAHVVRTYPEFVADFRNGPVPGDERSFVGGVDAQECRQLGIVTQDPTLLRMFRDVKKGAKSPLTVLFLGEPGTGKELFAKAVHRLSPRAGKTFIAVNMAAISPELFESELFGHEAGAFTGAIADRRGKLQEANGGVLFLDEIGELAEAFDGMMDHLATAQVGDAAPVTQCTTQGQTLFIHRPRRRVIQSQIEDHLSDGILSGKFSKGDTVKITVEGEDLALVPEPKPEILAT